MNSTEKHIEKDWVGNHKHLSDDNGSKNKLSGIRDIFSNVKKRHVWGVVVLAIASVGLAVGLNLLKVRQELRSKAVYEGVVVYVNNLSDTVEFGNGFTSQIMVSTQKKIVGAADIYVKVDPEKFEILDITPGVLFGESGTPYGDLDPVVLKKEINTEMGFAQISLGVPCTPCYVGSDPGDGTPQCDQQDGFRCYPVDAGSLGAAANLSLRALANTGSSGILVDDIKTEFGIVGEDLDAVVIDLPSSVNDTSLNVTISCSAADLDSSGSVTEADVTLIRNLWNTKESSPSYNVEYDYNLDGVINGSDIQQVANRLNNTCN